MNISFGGTDAERFCQSVDNIKHSACIIVILLLSHRSVLIFGPGGFVFLPPAFCLSTSLIQVFTSVVFLGKVIKKSKFTVLETLSDTVCRWHTTGVRPEKTVVRFECTLLLLMLEQKGASAVGTLSLK